MLVLTWCAPARAQVADFDALAEGTNGPVIVSGGLTFTNLDNRGLSPIPGNLAIERADGDLAGQPNFTPQNALGFGGYSMGPGAAFGRFGAVEITSGGIGGVGELTVYEGGGQGGYTITLEALDAGVVVDSDTQALSAGFGITSHVGSPGTELEFAL